MLDFVKPIQSSVIQIIHHSVGLKYFLFHLKRCLFVVIIIYVYFTYISQDSVKMHLWCGGIYDCKLSTECASEIILKIGQ